MHLQSLDQLENVISNDFVTVDQFSISIRYGGSQGRLAGLQMEEDRSTADKRLEIVVKSRWKIRGISVQKLRLAARPFQKWRRPGWSSDKPSGRVFIGNWLCFQQGAGLSIFRALRLCSVSMLSMPMSMVYSMHVASLYSAFIVCPLHIIPGLANSATSVG